MLIFGGVFFHSFKIGVFLFFPAQNYVKEHVCSLPRSDRIWSWDSGIGILVLRTWDMRSVTHELRIDLVRGWVVSFQASKTGWWLQGFGAKIKNISNHHLEKLLGDQIIYYITNGQICCLRQGRHVFFQRLLCWQNLVSPLHSLGFTLIPPWMDSCSLNIIIHTWDSIVWDFLNITCVSLYRLVFFLEFKDILRRLFSDTLNHRIESEDTLKRQPYQRLHEYIHWKHCFET